MIGLTLDMMGSGLTGPQAKAISGSMQLSQTATGNSQATAFLLTFSDTEFTTVAASTGAILPAPIATNGGPGRVQQSDCLAVYNQGANTLTVYPPVGFKIGLASMNAGVSIASGKSAVFVARGDGNYFANISA